MNNEIRPISPELEEQMRKLERLKSKGHELYAFDGDSSRIYQFHIGGLNEDNTVKIDDVSRLDLQASVPNNVPWEEAISVDGEKYFATLGEALEQWEKMRETKLKEVEQKLTEPVGDSKEDLLARRRLVHQQRRLLESTTVDIVKVEHDNRTGGTNNILLESWPLPPLGNDTTVAADSKVEAVSNEQIHDLSEKVLHELFEKAYEIYDKISKMSEQPFFAYFPESLKAKVIRYLQDNNPDNFSVRKLEETSSGLQKDSVLEYENIARWAVLGGQDLLLKLNEGMELALSNAEVSRKGEGLHNLKIEYDFKYDDGAVYIINPDGSSPKTGGSENVKRGSIDNRRAFVECENITNEVVLGINTGVMSADGKELRRKGCVIWKPKEITPEQLAEIREIEDRHGLGTTIESDLGLKVENPVLDSVTAFKLEQADLAAKEDVSEIYKEFADSGLRAEEAINARDAILWFVQKFGQSKVEDVLAAMAETKGQGKKLDKFWSGFGLGDHSKRYQFRDQAANDGNRSAVWFMADAEQSTGLFIAKCEGLFRWLMNHREQIKLNQNNSGVGKNSTVKESVRQQAPVSETKPKIEPREKVDSIKPQPVDAQPAKVSPAVNLGKVDLSQLFGGGTKVSKKTR